MGWEEGTVGIFCRRWWGWRGGAKGYLRAIGTTGHRSAHTHAHAPHTHTHRRVFCSIARTRGGLGRYP